MSRKYKSDSAVVYSTQIPKPVANAYQEYVDAREKHGRDSLQCRQAFIKFANECDKVNLNLEIAAREL